MAHPVMWFEVLGNDGAKLQQFYGSLFGWTFDVIQPINYGVTNMSGGRGIPGGIGQTFPGTRSWTTFYIETTDVTASRKEFRGSTRGARPLTQKRLAAGPANRRRVRCKL